MKIYCRNCGKGVEYELKAPSICGYCSTNYSSASNIKAQLVTPTVPAIETSFQFNNRTQRPNPSSSRFSRREEYHQDNSSNSYDGEDVEDIDIDYNDPDYSNIQLNYSKVQRSSISDVKKGNSPNNVEISAPAPLEPESENTAQTIQNVVKAPQQKRKVGRPSKNAERQSILDEFQKEAGALKPKTRK